LHFNKTHLNGFSEKGMRPAAAGPQAVEAAAAAALRMRKLLTMTTLL